MTQVAAVTSATRKQSPNISTMAGWIDDAFNIGFTVPMLEAYILHWQGNSPIEIIPKRE